VSQLLLELQGAIAPRAGPSLRSILIAAFATVMRILHAHKVEVFPPIRALFLKRSRTITDFHPASRLVRVMAGVVHVAKVFALGYRSLPKGLLVDGFQQSGFPPWPNTTPHQIPHL